MNYKDLAQSLSKKLKIKLILVNNVANFKLNNIEIIGFSFKVKLTHLNSY